MRQPFHGGQNARDWRRKVAALATKQSESVFTYKFRLDAEADDIDFEAAGRAYDIAEGVGRGSLIGLLCAVHLSGFRVFSNEGEAGQFRNNSRYPVTDFTRALAAHVGIENTNVTIQSVERVFSSPPRSSGGVRPSWSKENLATRLYSSWNGQMAKERAREGAEFIFAEGIADAVVRHFGDWRELANDVPRALDYVDSYLKTLGSFPKLGDMPPSEIVRPQNCTLAYDKCSPFIEMKDDEDIWMHRVVSVCAARMGRDGQNPSGPMLNRSIVAPNNNGLNWMLGTGLRYLWENDIKVIAEDLDVPKTEYHRVEQLKAFADAIPPNPFFDTNGYAEFRNSVGGKVQSWVSNYWKRLEHLDKMHAQPPEFSMPDALRGPKYASLFSGQHTDASGLEALGQQLGERVQQASDAIKVLKGYGTPDGDHVAKVELVAGYVSDLAGQVSMLHNRIEQEIKIASAQNPDASHISHMVALKKTLADSVKLEQPPKINRISGGTDEAAGEVERLERDFNATVRARREHFRKLSQCAEMEGPIDPLPAMAELERRVLFERKRDTAGADDQALRRLLHRIVGMSRRLSSDLADQVRKEITPLFIDSKAANLYFHNRKGAIYRHPFSNSRHDPYILHLGKARETDWLAWLERRIEDVRNGLTKGNGHTDPGALRDLLLLEGFVFTQRLRGLPEIVPGDRAKLESGEGVPDVPALLAAQLEAEEVPRDIALRTFNLFESAINGLAFRAFREGFIVRVRFQREGHDEFFYAPKNKEWSPPKSYALAQGEIRLGLELPEVARNKTGEILPLLTTENLSNAGFPDGSHALLRQMPHDWLVELDIRSGTVPQRAGLPLKKNRSGLKLWRNAKRPAFRLSGPPSFGSKLGRTLTNGEIKLGDYTLILDRIFKQSARMEDEEIRLSAEPVNLKSELAVAVIDHSPYPDVAPDLLFDNIVSIDLGEKRIGFAVFSLKEFLDNGTIDPIETGTVAIPAFRRLMAAVRRHRGSRQPNQKVGLTYSKALMQFRENVIGDVCNRIDTLCEQFGAFPVLESSLGNFESGGRQILMIYGSVLHRYTFSKTEAHKKLRRQYWHTGDSWEHPYLKVYGWNTSKKDYSGTSKPLKIFPGVTVNPAGTSQTCHSCCRNALTALRNMPKDVEVEKDGRVIVEDGVVKLYLRADYPPAELKQFRRRKERPPLNVALQEGNYRRSRVEQFLKFNMRQPPKSEMSPDTTQAHFVCAYEDCGFDGHADENAAINIGRRFLDRIDIDQSRVSRRT